MTDKSKNICYQRAEEDMIVPTRYLRQFGWSKVFNSLPLTKLDIFWFLDLYRFLLADISDIYWSKKVEQPEPILEKNL